MRALLGKVRTRVGYAAVGVLLTLAAGGVATAAVIDNPVTDEVSDVAPAPTETTETTAVPSAPAVTDAPAPVPADSPVGDTPAASVEGVTEPEGQPTPKAEPEPEPTQPYDPGAPWVDPSGVTFIPAPERTPEPPPVLD